MSGNPLSSDTVKLVLGKVLEQYLTPGPIVNSLDPNGVPAFPPDVLRMLIDHHTALASRGSKGYWELRDAVRVCIWHALIAEYGDDGYAQMSPADAITVWNNASGGDGDAVRAVLERAIAGAEVSVGSKE